MALRYPDIFNREARTPTIDQDLSVSLPLDYKFKLMTKSPTVAVVIHMFYPKMIDQIIKYVMNIPFNVKIYISTDSTEKRLYMEERLRRFKVTAELRVTAPQGRDMAPRLLGFHDVYENNDYTLLLHSKASLHDPELKDWGKYLFESLLGSRSVVESIFAIFDEAPEVGLIAAQHFEPVRKNLGWGENFEFCEALAARFGVDLKANGFLDFPSGSMLWARTAALRPFFDAGLVLGDFSPDQVGRQIDGTMAHAIERLFFVAAERAGFSWIKVAQPHLFERQDTIKPISDSAELHQFVANQRRILASHGRRTGVGGSTSGVGIFTPDFTETSVAGLSSEFEPVPAKSSYRSASLSAEAVYEAMRRSAMRNWVGPGDPAIIGRTNFSSIIENITLRPNHSILDFGCGIGRTSAALAEFLSEGGRLVGTDIVPGQIQFCRDQFGKFFPNAIFYCVRASNPQYDHLVSATETVSGIIDEAEFFSRYRLEFDATIAFSVFTHFDPTMAGYYLKALNEITKPSGHLLLTWFLDHPNNPAEVNGMRARLKSGESFIDPGGELGFAVFSLTAVAQLAADAGLLIERVSFGSWRGGEWSTAPLKGQHYQDILVLRRTPSTTTN